MGLPTDIDYAAGKINDLLDEMAKCHDVLVKENEEFEEKIVDLEDDLKNAGERIEELEEQLDDILSSPFAGMKAKIDHWREKESEMGRMVR